MALIASARFALWGSAAVSIFLRSQSSLSPAMHVSPGCQLACSTQGDSDWLTYLSGGQWLPVAIRGQLGVQGIDSCSGGTVAQMQVTSTTSLPPSSLHSSSASGTLAIVALVEICYWLLSKANRLRMYELIGLLCGDLMYLGLVFAEFMVEATLVLSKWSLCCRRRS
eukprot:3630207-Amphidinium_carterae.1